MVMLWLATTAWAGTATTQEVQEILGTVGWNKNGIIFFYQAPKWSLFFLKLVPVRAKRNNFQVKYRLLHYTDHTFFLELIDNRCNYNPTPNIKNKKKRFRSDQNYEICRYKGKHVQTKPSNPSWEMCFSRISATFFYVLLPKVLGHLHLLLPPKHSHHERTGLRFFAKAKELLRGSPRKFGSKVSKWDVTPIYSMYR